jgi:hypothetical protein
MATEKWTRREKKLLKKKTGMRVTGRSIFTIQEIQRKKAEAIKKGKKPKTKAKNKKKKKK